MRHPFGWRKPKKIVFLRMFIRKKKNRSGATSVVVVDKHSGVYHEIHNIGLGNDTKQI